MEMEHDEYLALQKQLQDHFDGRYRQINDCKEMVDAENDKIEKLKDTINGLKIEQVKTNTRLGIVIGMLSAIAVPLLGICIKVLFGT
jgi:hypothetical protein